MSEPLTMEKAVDGVGFSIFFGLVALAMGTCAGLSHIDVTVNVNEPATITQPRATPDSETNPAPSSGTGRGEDE